MDFNKTDLIIEKIRHESQEMASQQDGSLVFEAVVAGIREIKYWVLGWGSNACILEPEALREEVKAEARAMGLPPQFS
jgi:proteasome accessory factor B